MHKNWRFMRFDDVDMGDEVEAAIYNNNGKSAPESLKKFVNAPLALPRSVCVKASTSTLL